MDVNTIYLPMVEFAGFVVRLPCLQCHCIKLSFNFCKICILPAGVPKVYHPMTKYEKIIHGGNWQIVRKLRET